MAKDNVIGGVMKRREDVRFLKGRGRYTDDMNRPGQTYAYILRSWSAHATLDSVDTSAADAAPGVVRVFTGKDIEEAGLGSVPCGWQITDKHGDPMKEPGHPILAIGKVRHVGDPIAVVVAETYQQARDAAEMIDIEMTDLPAVVDMRTAETSGNSVHDEATDNVCFDWELGDKDASDAAFASAAHVTTLELVNNRLVANPMEPRCAIGDYDEDADHYTLYTTSQNPHVIRLLMGAFVLSIPEHKLRVYAPDVGGGFGAKIFHYAEEAFVTWASAQIRRPVKWTSDRSEAFISDAHGRDHVTKAELAMDADGKFLALRADTYANMGAYLSTFAPAVPTWLHGTLLAGQYLTPAVHCQRIINKAAQEMGMDQAELRRKNFIRTFPYATPVALEYDTGDYDATLDAVMKMADYEGFEARKAESASRGKLRGIGLSCYIEACGIAPSSLVGALGARAGLYEAATIRVNPTGSVTVMTGSHSHGQGHETTFAQVVSDALGIPADQIEIVHGDTDKIPFGMGTYGSRSLAVGGSAIVKAVDKVVAKGKKIAAHLLEAAESDIVFEDGQYKVAGTDKAKAFAEVSLAAYVPHNYPLEEIEPGLEETAFYDPKNFTYPAGSYLCEVEVDPETGKTEIVALSASDDFGNIVNPMIVEGQVHGGLAQGIGQAMLENAAYDEHGQLVSGSYMDYAMPLGYHVRFRIHPSDGPLRRRRCSQGRGRAGDGGRPDADPRAQAAPCTADDARRSVRHRIHEGHPPHGRHAGHRRRHDPWCGRGQPRCRRRDPRPCGADQQGR